jgi:hypothetical protein
MDELLEQPELDARHDFVACTTLHMWPGLYPEPHCAQCHRADKDEIHDVKEVT